MQQSVYQHPTLSRVVCVDFRVDWDEPTAQAAVELAVQMAGEGPAFTLIRLNVNGDLATFALQLLRQHDPRGGATAIHGDSPAIAHLLGTSARGGGDGARRPFSIYFAPTRTAAQDYLANAISLSDT